MQNESLVIFNEFLKEQIRYFLRPFFPPFYEKWFLNFAEEFMELAYIQMNHDYKIFNLSGVAQW